MECSEKLKKFITGHRCTRAFMHMLDLVTVAKDMKKKFLKDSTTNT
ncbi:25006_t:CDS:1, partial [Gigaspora rosea]